MEDRNQRDQQKDLKRDQRDQQSDAGRRSAGTPERTSSDTGNQGRGGQGSKSSNRGSQSSNRGDSERQSNKRTQDEPGRQGGRQEMEDEG